MIFYNARIWTMDNGIIENGFMKIKDNLIEMVGNMSDGLKRAGGEDEIDLKGKIILPGFVDAHSHLGLCDSGLGMEGDDLNEDTDPATPHLRSLDGINPFDDSFKDAANSGVTSAVISPGSANPVSGQISAVKTVGRSIDEMLIKGLVGVKFSLGENPKMTYGIKTQSPITRMGTAAIIREQLYKAKRYMEERNRAQADSDEYDLPDFDAKCEALIPVLTGEAAAHFHAHMAYDILTAVRISKEFALDYKIVHGTEGYLIGDILAKEGARVICGPLICGRTKPELANLKIQNCALLISAGVEVAVSTDHPEIPVEYLLMSAAVAKSTGLDGYQAINTITYSAAKLAGIEARVGSITKGKDADFLVFDGDIFDIGAKPQMVYIDGKRIK